MYFNIIASGSKGNATIVVSKDTVILIDMGIAFSRLEEGMREINLEPKDIDAALFTHEHTDHINGLKSFSPKSIPTIGIIAPLQPAIHIETTDRHAIQIAYSVIASVPQVEPRI